MSALSYSEANRVEGEAANTMFGTFCGRTTPPFSNAMRLCQCRGIGGILQSGAGIEGHTGSRREHRATADFTKQAKLRRLNRALARCKSNRNGMPACVRR